MASLSITILIGVPWPRVLHLHSTSVSWWANVAMWAAMSVVMMAPTAVPMLRSYFELPGRRVAGCAAFLGAYVAVWAVSSVVPASVQWYANHHGVLVDHTTGRAPTMVAAVLLAVAGAYQLTPLKQRCLTACSRPMTFLLQHWRDGVVGALRMGARHGVTCVGCCWALMSLAFVGGVMNLWFMVGATVLMAVEKLPPVRERLTVPLGAVLLVAAIGVFVAGVRPA